MKRVIYVSHRHSSTSNVEINNIVNVAKEFNNIHDIKGVLVSLPDHFYQVLEGPDNIVIKLMERIEKDHRHHSVNVFSDEAISNYEFGKWSMIHHDIDEEFADFFYLLSNFANHPNYEDTQIRGIKMMLLGLS